MGTVRGTQNPKAVFPNFWTEFIYKYMCLKKKNATNVNQLGDDYS